MKVVRWFIFFLAAVLPMVKTSNRQGRSLVYPNAGICKLIIGMAVPVNVPKKNLSWGTNFQFQYKLPPNATELHMLPEVGRSLRHTVNRASLYGALEAIMDRQGLDGKSCLLRSICEVAETPIHFHNGLFGDLLHVILSPGPNSSEEMNGSYYEAQRLGMEGVNCGEAFPKCIPGKGILDMVSIIYNEDLY